MLAVTEDTGKGTGLSGVTAWRPAGAGGSLQVPLQRCGRGAGREEPSPDRSPHVAEFPRPDWSRLCPQQEGVSF